ncbi:uncharacterized protein LOC132704902 [Cylas formicarius]|uniref:uncharacterized protein LOC132704902 n=1 Tax=Cylas formicarius TaxID=197179 RepID=UPI0029589077|nr:uncharacterized protein LOC132704902 [Cylas formicarius]
MPRRRRWPITTALVFLACAMTTSSEQRQRHRELQRLVGGHLRLDSAANDDAEPLEAASAGAGKDKKTGGNHDEERKTLSQQVADGKYGLIQKELFAEPPRRPGVLSYDPNPEVPKDNVKTYGGLSKNEIWLAENHLLVIRGGAYPPHDDRKDYHHHEPVWQPIDDYNAPLHQVKIPKHPKVPPPFPVQLTEDGPLQIVGTNFTRTLNGTEAATAYALPPPFDWEQNGGGGFGEAQPPAGAANSDQTDPVTRKTPVRVPGQGPGERDGGLPFPPSNPLNGTWPPSFDSLPPGTVVVEAPPPPDEDDPSIYYPPPYSFYYPKEDNATAVPPGPLVPGIILPPPPNFFAPLEEETSADVTTTTTTHRPPPAPRKPTKHHRPPKPKKSTLATTTEKSRGTFKPIKKKPTVTILRPVKPEGGVSTPKVHEIAGGGKPFRPYEPLPAWKSVAGTTTTTQVPLKYYTTSNSIESNTIPQRLSFDQYRPQTTRKPAAQYYFYEEPERRPAKIYDGPKNYYLPATTTKPPSQILYATKPYSTARPRYRLVPQRTDSFSIHVAKLQQQIHQYHVAEQQQQRPRIKPSPKPVYQFSFQANNYRRPNEHHHHHPFKPSPPLTSQDNHFMPLPKYSVQIQQAVEVVPPATHPPPDYYVTPSKTIAEFSYRAVTTPNPVHQGYYTKPDEGFFDENTKHSFTVFGRKLPIDTTPMPNRETQFNENAAEVVKAIEINPPGAAAYVSYQLPGDDGAHFYFLTPQLARERDQRPGYYFKQGSRRKPD